VPKARVRLDKDTVTDEQHVSEEVRKDRGPCECSILALPMASAGA
jgi:hypothetical protein